LVVEGLLVADAIGVNFGALRALDGVSFEVRGPTLVCVLGPNGAGKTTLFEVLAGMRTPNAGRVSLFGQAVAADRYPKRRVGVVLQREFVLDEVRVGEYAELFASIFAVDDGARKIVAAAKLAGREKTSVARLSGGEAQRLFIAAACVHDPDVMLLDEPTSDLDPKSKEDVGAMLREQAKKRTILMTTHDLAEAESLAEEVLFLVRGKVAAFGATADVKKKAGAETLREAFFELLPKEQAADVGELS
jgi:ABC-2 type transport system ATP-binding protein